MKRVKTEKNQEEIYYVFCPKCGSVHESNTGKKYYICRTCVPAHKFTEGDMDNYKQ